MLAMRWGRGVARVWRFPQPGQGNLPVKLSDIIAVCPTKCSRVCRGASYKVLAPAPTKCSWISRSIGRLFHETGGQVLEISATLPCTGGGLFRRVMPQSSSSRRAARYWLSTMSRVWRKTRLKLSIRP
jgi:hypothetical protein